VIKDIQVISILVGDQLLLKDLPSLLKPIVEGEAMTMVLVERKGMEVEVMETKVVILAG
jgi:hypothetical protein